MEGQISNQNISGAKLRRVLTEGKRRRKTCNWDTTEVNLPFLSLRFSIILYVNRFLSKRTSVSLSDAT